MKYFFVSFFCFFSVFASTQNLVQNGSFEKHLPIECLFCHTRGEAFSNLLKGWESLHSTPILCDCEFKQSKDDKKHRTCRMDNVSPKTGCSMVEMQYRAQCMDFNHDTKGCATYLGTPFEEPLKFGKVYEISLWLYIPKEHKTDPEFPNNIGVGLYPQVVRNPNGNMIENSTFSIDSVLYDTWFEATWQVRPLCNLNYMVVGVFRNGKWPFDHTYSNFSPYFIDDVSVKEIIPTGEQKEKIVSYCRPSTNTDESLSVVVEGATTRFSSNSPSLTTEEFPILDSFAMRAKQYPNATFTITGHTDNVGENHVELSKDRVESILQYLRTKHRIPKFRFVPVFAGDSEPIESNDTEEGRRLNRRVEIAHSNYKLPNVFYRNILLYLKEGNINDAYKVLFAWLNVVDHEEKILVLFDTRLEPLKKDRRWKKIENKINKSYHQFEESRLAYWLDSLWAEDQKYRTLKYGIENLNTYLFDVDKNNTMWDVSFHLDNDSISIRDDEMFHSISALIEKQGWPKSSIVGERSAKAVFLISTHSNDTLALSNLVPLVEKRCLEGEAEWYWYATMFDRLATLKGLPQRYGTQYQVLEGGNKLFPLEDETKVNEWREKIGLPSIKIN